jgi:phage terminase large subunit GpA-like protein
MIPVGQRVLAKFTAAPLLQLSTWIEANISLPEGTSASPGPMRLWPWQHEIADAISDPKIERATLLKASRIGFTALTIGAIGAYVVNEPASILVLLPTDSDCRDFVVSDIEPTFAASSTLRRALSPDREEGVRDTLASRRFAGGSLKIVAAKAPRNLRRHTCRILIVDEADAMEVGAEGNPIKLAERRTLTFANRKIVVGSTPIFEDTSHVVRSYRESDGRVFECPCPACGGCTEIMWAHIVWPPDDPSAAAFECPHCKALIEEKHKAAMVAAGQWRATRLEVQGHAGFRLNSLVSLLANASWPKLAAEFVAAKDDVTLLQTFVNTVLAQPWTTPAMVDEATLMSRAEPFSLDDIPPEVLAITCGIDMQDDRAEASIVGWTRDAVALVLAHFIIWGSYQDTSFWQEVDEMLRSTWRHPHGGRLKIDATGIDCSDGDHFASVADFAYPRTGRRVFATKGMGGVRSPFQMAKGKKLGNKFAIVGVDGLKGQIFDRLRRGRGIRFGNTLELDYFAQLASERRTIKYVRGMPVRQFVRTGRVRNEALDCLTYNFAVRQSLSINYDRRAAELRNYPLERQSIASRLAR